MNLVARFALEVINSALGGWESRRKQETSMQVNRNSTENRLDSEPLQE